MSEKDLKEVKKHFVKYVENPIGGESYYHKMENFYIIISRDNEVYQLNSDHERQGIELDTLENLKTRFKSFTGEDL